MTVVDFTVTTPKENSIFITSESFDFSGSVEPSGLITFLKWRYGDDFSGLDASGSQDITTAGKHALSLYIGDDYESADVYKDFGVIYVSDASSGVALDILGIDVEVSLDDLAEKAAGAIVSLLGDANDAAASQLSFEQYGLNSSRIAAAEDTIVTEVKSIFDDLLGIDLIGGITDKVLEGSSGGLNSFISYNFGARLSPDWGPIIEGGDIMELTTVNLGIGLDFVLFNDLNVSIDGGVESTLDEIENIDENDIKVNLEMNMSF